MLNQHIDLILRYIDCTDAWDNIESDHQHEVLETAECKQRLQEKAKIVGLQKDLQNKLTQTETKELRYAKAGTAKQQMQANRTTQVVVLDGSKAMRDLSTNNMKLMLEICKIETCQDPAGAKLKQKTCGWEELVEVFKKAKESSESWGPTKEESWTLQRTECSDKGIDERKAPVFASFSGMDLLGKGVKRQFPESQCIGGSEINGSARVLFERDHGFAPFRDHGLVPRYAYEKVFLVTTSAPCVAFSRACKQ